MLKSGSTIGKYRLVQNIGAGSFGSVWKGEDKIEGVKVAIKIPHSVEIKREAMEDFRSETRAIAQFDHKNILRMKNADVINGKFIIVTELGNCSLREIMTRPLSTKLTLKIVEQILDGLSAMHRKRIIHRDIKPENIILFSDSVAKLADFSTAKVLERSQRTGQTMSGTLGYMAPEQAFAKPVLQSDIFAVGMLMNEMITGMLPSWPYQWPFKSYERLHKKAAVDVVHIIKKATALNPNKRYPNAEAMLGDVSYARNKLIEKETLKKPAARAKKPPTINWKKYQQKEFEKRFSKKLELIYGCFKCKGPISEYMMYCPWCGTNGNVFEGISTFPFTCFSCGHGIYAEWKYCPWCYGSQFSWSDESVTVDGRYISKCSGKRCSERALMKYMHYCPWCNKKVRPWRNNGFKENCHHCKWFVLKEYWDYCPWCGMKVRK